MSREKILVKNTIIYALGSLGTKMINFLLLPFYTYFLTKTDYGYYDLIISTTSVLMPLVSFQLNDGMYRYMLSVTNDKDKKDVFTNAFFIVTLNLLIFNVIYFFCYKKLNIQFGNLILIMFNLSVIADLINQALRGLRHNLQFALSGVIAAIITIASNILLIVFLNRHVDGLLISGIVSSLCVLVYVNMIVKVYKLFDYRYIKFDTIAKLVKFSIPLIPNIVSWWVMNLSDRLLLKHYLGIEAIGIYAVANKFPSLLATANYIFSLAWQESAILEYKSEDRNRYYSKVFDLLSTFMFTCIICLLAFTRFIIRYMVSDKFGQAALYIPFLYLGTLFSLFSSFYGTGYLSSEKTIGAFTTSIFGAAINIVMNILLIPVIGIQAASLSTMLSFLAMWLFRIYQTKKYFNIYINKKKLSILLFVCSIFLFIYYVNNVYLEVLSMIMSILILLLLNREIVNKVIGKLSPANRKADIE